MRTNPEEGYEVGYKKPPKATRYKKGESGNPNGRPRRIDEPFDPSVVLQAVENEQVVVALENGKRKLMTKLEAQFRQLFKKAIAGDLKAARAIVRMAEVYFTPDARAVGPGEVMNRREARRRFGKDWEKKVEDWNAQFRSIQ